MKTILPIAVLLLAFAAQRSVSQTPLAAPQAATGVIEGIITRAGTTESIPGVTVQLNVTQAARGAGITPDQPALDSVTDEAGHFIFKNLYAGPYQMRYVLDGFFFAPEGVRANVTVSRPGTAGAQAATLAFALDLKQPIKLALEMIPGGVISGRVSDSNGRPVAAGQVAAMRIAYQDGQRILTAAKTAPTNDRGDYRLFGLEPGEYYVRSEYRRAATVPSNGQDIFRAYFPGVEDPNSAAPTTVRSGTESSGTNIAIRSSTTVTISGTVILPPSLMPGPEAEVPIGARGGTPQVGAATATLFYLVPLDAAGLRDDTVTFPNSIFGAADRSAGKFEIRGVRPGRYDLYTIVRTNPVNAQERYAGHASVSVGNQDLAGVNLTISAGVELRARFTSMDPAAVTQAPTQLSIRARNGLPSAIQQVSQAGARGARGARGGVSNDWHLYPGLSEGMYVLDSPLQSLRDTYVADIRQGEKSIYDTATIVVGSTAPDPVEVILARPAASIDGTVLNASGKPAAGVSVMLIPNGDRRQNPLLYKRGITNTDGKVALGALAPGSYKLFAWESILSGAELNAEFIREYEERGVPVTIEAGVQLKVQLPLIEKGV